MPHGGGGQQMHFPPSFFNWLCQQLIIVDDYAYVGIDFKGDLDVPLPLGEQWTNVGKAYFWNFSSFMSSFV